MQDKPEKNIILYNFLYTIFKYKRFIVIVTGFFFFLVIFFSWLTTPTWNGTSKILVRAMSQQQLTLFEDMEIPIRDNPQINPGANLIQVLYSRDLAEEVVSHFELDKRLEEQKTNPEKFRNVVKNGITGVMTSPFTLAKSLGLLPDKPQNYFEDSLKRLMEESEKIELEESTQVITITISEQDPILASLIANYMAESLVDKAAEMDQFSASRALEFTRKKLLEAEKELKETEDKLLVFTKNENIVSLEYEKRSKLELIARIESDLSQVTADLSEVRAKLDGLQGQVATQREFLKATTLISSNPTVGRLKADLNNLEAALAGAQAELSGLEIQITQQRDVLSPSTVVTSSPTVAQLKQRLNDQETNLAGLLENYAEGDKDVMQLKAQIAQSKELLKEEMNEILKNEVTILSTVHPDLPNEFVEAMTRVMSLQAQIDVGRSNLESELAEILKNEVAVLSTIHGDLPKDFINTMTTLMSLEAKQEVMNQQLVQLKQEGHELTVKGLEYDRLNRNVTANRDLFTNLMNKYTQLQVQSATEFSGLDLQIIQRANLPADAKQDWPIWILNIPLGMIASLLLGLGGAFFVEYWTENFRIPKDVEDRLGLPVLCTLPDITSRKKSSQ